MGGGSSPTVGSRVIERRWPMLSSGGLPRGRGRARRPGRPIRDPDSLRAPPMPTEAVVCQGAGPAGIMRPSRGRAAGVGRYHRSELRGFRRFAMVFWDAPRDGLIYGSLEMDATKALRFIEDVKAKHGI